MDELCELLDLQRLKPLAGHSGPLAVCMEIDATAFCLLHDEKQPELLVVHCEFGDLTEGNAAEQLRSLMEINLALARQGGGAMGLDGESQRLIYTCRAAVNALHPHALLQRLHHLAAQALQWREGTFLKDSGSPAAFAGAIGQSGLRV
jgi:hypothetical protein